MLKMLAVVEENIFKCIKTCKSDQEWSLVIRFECEKDISQRSLMVLQLHHKIFLFTVGRCQKYWISWHITPSIFIRRLGNYVAKGSCFFTWVLRMNPVQMNSLCPV